MGKHRMGAVRRHRLGAAAVAAATLTVLSASGPLPRAGQPPDPPAARASAALYVTVPAQFSFDDLAPGAAAALAHADPTPAALAAGTATLARPPKQGPVGSSPRAGTPQAVLAAAYRKAVSRAPRGCHLEVAHLAAIGQVESGSIGGRSVTADHRVTPAIYGPLLDGGPFAVIRDSDGGSYDGAGDFDRAMGPLQFLPGTWSWAGRDGDGDGRRDPQNLFDAAAATAHYLCLDGRDLARAGDLRAAVLSYNASDAYHSAVTEWVSYFERNGLAALTAVAFRVGSGGRASAMALPTPAPTPPTTPPVKAAPTRAAPTTSSPKPPRAGSGVPATPTTTQPTTAPTTSTPSPSPTPTPTPAEQPSPDPTTPAPSPSTTPPAAVGPPPAGAGAGSTTGR